MFVVAIQYDYLAWTEQVAMAVDKALSLKHVNEGYSGFVLFLSGDVSGRARDELNAK